MPGRVRERPRLGRSRGSQEDPENRGHVIGRDKEASQEAGRQRRRERFPLCQGRKTEPWKMVKMTEVEKVCQAWSLSPEQKPGVALQGTEIVTRVTTM